MGSKKLKAVVVKGEMKVPVDDIDKVNEIRKKHWEEMKASGVEGLHTFGTCVHTDSWCGDGGAAMLEEQLTAGATAIAMQFIRDISQP